MKKGLVMEGGAMRGMFTAGVTDVMMENNITFDGAIGVSAGAAFGCNYKSNQPGRVIRYNKRFCNDKRFCSFRSLRKTGDLYGHEFCYYTVPNELDIFDRETYKNSPMEFYAVATNVHTGKPAYFNCPNGDDNDLEAYRASASMPLVSNMVEINGEKFLDGGLSDSVPLAYFESIGYDRNVVILTRPRGYIKCKNKLMPLIKLKYRKYPNFVNTVANRHIMYNDEMKYIYNAEKEGRAFLIVPDEALDIGFSEKSPEKLQEIYEIGRQTAEKRLAELREFLGSKL
ncbi:MAG: patatin family protein [Ruminococcaceae bacterium]|nr:patatin family protein [Oscillospiraceae bacterium]